MKLCRLSISIAICALGVSCTSQRGLFTPVQERGELRPFILTADAAAEGELSQINKATDAYALHVRKYGPFKLAEYRRTLIEKTEGENRYLYVNYELTRSVPFFGYPDVFSVEVNEKTGDAIMMGGE